MKAKLLLTALLSFSPADAGFCRKLLNFCLLSFVFCLGTAQTPQGFNYQAIARDGSGNPIAGATINVKLSILTDTAGFRATGGGVYLWEEEHLNVTTNAYGLFTIVLGDPSASKVNGSATSFSVINWSLADLYIGTKIANPSTYKVLGAAKLWSVPYALRAKDSDQWQTNGTDIYRLTGKVGIGTSTPLVPLSVYSPGSSTTIHIGGTAAGLTYLSAGTSASTNGYSYLQSVKTAGTAYGDLIINNGGGNVGIGTISPTKKVEIGGTSSSVYLNSATSNLIEYNMQGVAPPSFTTRSAGTKIALYPGVSATTGEYALGIDASTFWMSVPNNTGNFKFYAGTSEIMRIMGTGNVGIGTNNPLALFHVAGNTRLNNSMVGDGIELQQYSSGNRYSGIDFHGDDTYTDYSLRIIRYNTGPDAGSSITHRGLGELNLVTQEAAPINFYTTNIQRMSIRAGGNVGIGTDNPTEKLEIQGTNSKLYLNSTTSNMLLFNPQGVAPPSFSTRSAGTKIVFYPNVAVTSTDFAMGIDGGTLWYSVPAATISNMHKFYAGTTELMRIRGDGNIGIGTASTTSKMVIQPPATWDDNTPLFEVKNKYGTSVLAVYNNGVRILVAHDAAKGVTKGGFAIGGFDNTKAMGETVNLMTVAPDSIRFNIDNDNVKGITKGGFAIGGFDVSKGINVNPKAFMNMTPLGSPNGQYNTFLGYGSGKYNTTGRNNAFIGYNAGLYNRTGDQNVIVGTGIEWTGLPPLTPTDMGSYNTFVGYRAGGYCTGTENTVVGNHAGVSLTIFSNYNSFFGRSTGSSFNNGSGNVFIGNEAGLHQTSGSNNTYVGAVAGWDNLTGSNNIFLGTNAGTNILGSNNIVIGSNNGTTVPAISGNNTLLIGPIVTNIPFICGNMAAYMLGVGRVPTSVTFEVGGDASKATAGSWLANSDFRIKKNIEDIDNALELIQHLHPVKFRYSDEWLKRYPIIKDRVYYNFIAQEYKEVFPESVMGSGEYLNGQPDEILQIDSYNSQIIAVKAIQELMLQNKEQQIQIESTKEENQLLKSQLQSLKEKMDRIEAMLVKGGVK
jgi:hypothetical protein